MEKRKCNKCGEEKGLCKENFEITDNYFRKTCRTCRHIYHQQYAETTKNGTFVNEKAELKKEGKCRCSKCKEIKEFNRENFSFHKSKLTSKCRICWRKEKRDYDVKNPDKKKNWYSNRKSKDGFVAENRKRAKNYYKKHSKCKWFQKKEALRKKKRRHGSIKVRIIDALRGRVYASLKNENTFKNTKTEELIGCNFIDVIEHLENQFTPQMTWQNYGKYGWHIDHIIPCTNFDLTKEEEQRKCFHYSNLRPLWATNEIAIAHGESLDYLGNLNKGAKII